VTDADITQIGEAVDAMPLPALVVDKSHRIIAANDEARALLGKLITDRHYTTVLRQPQVIDAIESCLNDGEPRQIRQLTYEGAQEATLDLYCRSIASLGAVLVSVQDVSPLEQAGQMRRDFVANVSHELRTPLTALSGFIETLRGAARNDPEARERFLGIMEGEASRMNRLVGDLLSLNRVESEERVRPTQQVDLSAQLRSTLTTLEPLAGDADVVLALTEPGGPVMIAGDTDQLQQVFSNLIENAIKYGGSGGRVDVVLTESARDPGLRSPAAIVQVIDKGPGIDPIHLPRLSERFYRADNHRSRRLGGTGLGLAIVKHIVGRHRGRLRMQSQPGQGSVFTVIFPT